MSKQDEPLFPDLEQMIRGFRQGVARTQRRIAANRSLIEQMRETGEYQSIRRYNARIKAEREKGRQHVLAEAARIRRELGWEE